MSKPIAPTNIVIAGYFLFLTVATILAYSNISQHEILRWDDNIYLNAELVQSLSWNNLLSILSEEHHGNWHPLTTLSFAIEHALWGKNATYSKVFNLFLHLANTLIFYVLCLKLLLLATTHKLTTNSPGILNLILPDRRRFALYSSLIAAAVFALHPQHVESVVWISERKGLLCASFYMLTLFTYLKANGTQRRFFLNLSFIFGLCAMMSKPVAISLPVALILLDFYPLKKISTPLFTVATLTTIMQGKLMFFVLAFASGTITLLFQNIQSSEVLGYVPRLINASVAYLHYLTSIVYPANLSPYYPFQQISMEPSIYSLIPVVLFLGLVLIVLALYVKGIRFPLIIFAYFVISMLPMIGIVKVGLQAMSDRYAYLSTIGFYMLIGVACFILYAALERMRYQYIVVIFIGALCAMLGSTTYHYTKHWQSDVPLWSRVIDIYPNSASIAYANLAAAHDVKGDVSTEQIGQLINKALWISPNLPYSLEAAANFHGKLGDEQKALGYLLKIIETAPYIYWVQVQLGDIYFQRNDMARAGNHYLAAIKHGSKSDEVIYRLALIDFYYQRYSQALSMLEVLSPAKKGGKYSLLHQKIQQALAASR